MKKILCLTGLILILTGCQTTPETNELQVMKCYNNAEAEGVIYDLDYEVEYKGLEVTRIKSTEIMEVSSQTEIDDTVEYLEANYTPFDNVEHYFYEITVVDGVITSTVDINYEEIDIDKVISIEPSIEALMENGKVSIDIMQELYETLGLTCDR